MNLTNKNAAAVDALQATTNAGGGRLLDLLHHAMVVLLHPWVVTKPPIFLPCGVVATFFFLAFANVRVLKSRRAWQVQKLSVGFLIPKGSKQHEGWVAGGSAWGKGAW